MNKDKFKKLIKNDWFLIGVVNALLLVYIISIGVWALLQPDINGAAFGSMKMFGKNIPLIAILIIMFCFELASTFTFQARIWLTSKNKIRIAACVGSISWMIAGFQGMLLISDSFNLFHDNESLNQWVSFFVKMPPVLVATFSGIVLTNTLQNVKKNNVEKKGE